MSLPDHDRPETYSAYRAVAKLRLGDGSGQVVIGLKPTGLVVHFEDGEVLHFDLEGRLLRIAEPGIQWRRGLSGRVLRLRRQARDAQCHGTTHGGETAGSPTGSPTRHANDLIAAANGRMRMVRSALGSEPGGGDIGSAERSQLYDLTVRAAAFDVQTAASDLASFRALYHDIPILPPDQYLSLVLLASDGCRYNKCTFCNFYRDTQYRIRSLEQFHQHVDQAVRYHGAALASRRDVFLGQANALLGPRAWRDEILQYVNERFEFPAPDTAAHRATWWQGSPTRFNGITSFVDAFIGARIEAEEFAALRRLNLKKIYIGLESGSAELLRWLRKPAEPAQMLEAVRAAKQGGVAAGVIVLVGAGGECYFDGHVRETVKLIREMQLTAGDFVYLSPLVSAHGAEYDALAAEADIEPLTPERMKQQEQLLRLGIGSSPTRRGPYVAHYEVEHFVY